MGLVVAAGLFLTGCGSDSGSGSGAAEGSGSGSSDQKPLAVPLTGPQQGVNTSASSDDLKVTPEPGNDAPFEERVEHSLRQKLVQSVGAMGTTSADCPDGVTLKANAVSTCTAVYEGAGIPFEVRISDKYKEDSVLVFYDSTPKKGLLAAKYVYQRFYENYGPDSGYKDNYSKLACDEIPAARAVPLNADTGYSCQYWSKYGGDDHNGGYVTMKVTMEDDDRPTFVEAQEGNG